MQKIKYKTKHKQLAKSLEGLCIEKYESETLNKLLVEFHAIVCKKDEEDSGIPESSTHSVESRI